MFGRYRKFVVSVVGAAVAGLVAWGGAPDVVTIIVAVATSLGVYAVPNEG